GCVDGDGCVSGDDLEARALRGLMLSQLSCRGRNWFEGSGSAPGCLPSARVSDPSMLSGVGGDAIGPCDEPSSNTLEHTGSPSLWLPCVSMTGPCPIEEPSSCRSARPSRRSSAITPSSWAAPGAPSSGGGRS